MSVLVVVSVRFRLEKLIINKALVQSVQRKSVVGDDLRSTTFAVSAYSVSGELHDSESCGIVERSRRIKHMGLLIGLKEDASAPLCCRPVQESASASPMYE